MGALALPLCDRSRGQSSRASLLRPQCVRNRGVTCGGRQKRGEPHLFDIGSPAPQQSSPMRNVCCFVLLLLCSVRGHAQSAESPTFRINLQRLQGTLEKLSDFGRNPEGGVTRLGFSETDLAAREYVPGLMRQAGLEVRVDPAGNIFGLRAGSEKLPTLLFGSHIDSVLHGGNFDGDVGSMGAIEVMRALNDERIKTRHPLEAVIWTNEEGNHFGIVRWVRVLRLGRLGLRFSKGKTSR